MLSWVLYLQNHLGQVHTPLRWLGVSFLSLIGFEFGPVNAKSFYSIMWQNQSLQLGNLCPLKYSNTGKTPVPAPGSPTGVNEDGVNGVTVTMWCNRALGGLTLHTSRISTHNRHLLQNCQVSPSLLCYLWEMKSAAEINCCIPPAMGKEENSSLSESSLRIFFVWSGF